LAIGTLAADNHDPSAIPLAIKATSAVERPAIAQSDQPQEDDKTHTLPAKPHGKL
jgi:hypothetical protein